MQDLYPSRTENRAAIRPRQDPVLRGEFRPDGPLTRAQLNRFDRDGYLVLEGWFAPDELAALQRETQQLLGRPETLRPETLISEREARDVRSIFAIHEQSALLRRLAEDERLAGVARLLLGGDVYVHQSRLNYKPGFHGQPFFWHSDFETWHVEDGMPRMRALSISLLLAENTSENGALMLMPGSHRSFVSCVGATPDDHYRQSLQEQQYGVPDEESLAALADKHGIVAATGKPGTILVFDCNIMHGSAGNITPYPRSNAFFVYNSVDNRLAAPFGPPKPRPEFLAERREVPAIRPVSGRLTGGTSGADGENTAQGESAAQGKNAASPPA